MTREADLDGNLWFTAFLAEPHDHGRQIDAKTGAFKAIKLAEPNGFASQTHGIARDENGFSGSTRVRVFARRQPDGPRPSSIRRPRA